jgi:hypothetical protein
VRATRLVAAAASLLLAGGLAGCALTPAEREEIGRAWTERDGERARECRGARGGFVAGGCVFGGGP